MKFALPAILLAAALPVAAQPQDANQPSPAQMFMQQLDANQDGKVTLEEFLKPHKEQFAYMDKNGDGAVTTEEAEAFIQEMKQRMQQMQQRHQGGGAPGQR